MATLTRKKKDDTAEPAQLLVAVDGFSAPSGVVRKGALIRADAAVVREAPAHFVPADSSDSEVHEAWSRLYDRPQEIAQADTFVPASEKRIAVADRTWTQTVELYSVEAGRVYLETDPIVVAHPEAFRAYNAETDVG